MPLIKKSKDNYVKHKGYKAEHEAEAAAVISQAKKKRMSHDEYMNYAGYSEDNKGKIREGIKKQYIPDSYAQGGEIHAHDGACYANGGMGCGHPYSIPEALRCKYMAQGGIVDNMEEAFGETLEDRDEAMADSDLYDDSQIEEQPEDSNERGDKLKDEDERGRKLFSKIKQKRAQPGDRSKG